jgi:hypothetical protein
MYKAGVLGNGIHNRGIQYLIEVGLNVRDDGGTRVI